MSIADMLLHHCASHNSLCGGLPTGLSASPAPTLVQPVLCKAARGPLTRISHSTATPCLEPPDNLPLHLASRTDVTPQPRLLRLSTCATARVLLPSPFPALPAASCCLRSPGPVPPPGLVPLPLLSMVAPSSSVPSCLHASTVRFLNSSRSQDVSGLFLAGLPAPSTGTDVDKCSVNT